MVKKVRRTKPQKVVTTIVSDKILLKAFDRDYPKFKHLVESRFNLCFKTALEHARERENSTDLICLLNTLWFDLPITHEKCRPDGYKELMRIINMEI